MKIAIPLFKERVSPHFGSSSRLLLVETNGGKISQEAKWEVGAGSPVEMARRLVDLGVEKLICGGIQSYCKEWLIKKGLIVVDNQKGAAEEIIRNLLQSER